MSIENVTLLHDECVACGLSISGVDSSGKIHLLSPDDDVAALILAAHEQPLSSGECLLLQAALSEEHWLSYVECRKAPIKTRRASLYKEITDPLMLKALEDSVKNNTTPDYSVWIAAKDAIRVANPYPE